MAARVTAAGERTTPVSLEIVGPGAEASPDALRGILARARPLIDEVVSLWPATLRKKIVVVVRVDEGGDVRVEARVGGARDKR